MKVIAKANQNHACPGEMIDLCVPVSGGRLSVWITVLVDFFHGSDFYAALRDGRTVELEIKALVD